MFCPNCGAPDVDGCNHCPNCGARLKQAPTPPPGPASSGEAGSPPPHYGGPTPPTASPSDSGGSNIFGLAAKIFSFVMAVVFAVMLLSKLGNLFSSLSYMGYLGIFYSLLSIVQLLLQMAGCLLLAAALALFGLRWNVDPDKSEPLLLTVALAAVVKIVLDVLSPLLSGIGSLVSGGYFYYYSGNLGTSLLLSIVSVVVLGGLVFLAGHQPFVGRSGNDLNAMLLSLPDFLSAEVAALSKRAPSGPSAAQTGGPVRPEASTPPTPPMAPPPSCRRTAAC